MRAAVIAQQGSPVAPNIRVVSDFADPPIPGPGQALVKTLASALNHLDLWVGKGLPGLNLTYPRISGSDACGVVESVGPGADPAWVGRTVILNAAIPVHDPLRPLDGPAPFNPDYRLLGEHENGAHAARFVAPLANLAAINDAQDPTEAAGFGLTFLTAYSMLVTKAQIKPGQTVLITGIGGGVATAALAIAKSWSCRAIVTSRHPWKLERAAALGADDGVLDKGEDWSRHVRKLTAGRGVDLAVDSSGKATHLWCIKSLARGGTYATPGCTSGPDATTDLARIFWNQLRLLGSTMGERDEFLQVAALYRDGALRPTIDKVFPAADAPAAYARLESAEQFGKIILDWR